MLSAREVIKAACTAPAVGISVDTVRAIIDQQGLQVLLRQLAEPAASLCADYSALLELVARARRASTVYPLYTMFGELMASTAAAGVIFSFMPVLPQVCAWWRSYRVVTQWMVPVFRGVDPGYSANYMRVTACAWLTDADRWTYLMTIAVRAFRNHWYGHVQGQFLTEVFHEAQRDRSGQQVDLVAMREAVALVRTMCMVEWATSLRTMADVDAVDVRYKEYIDAFEEPFVAAALQYYCALIDAWLAEGVPAYMVRVEAALAAENRRCCAYGLPTATVMRVVNGCRMVFLAASRAVDIVNFMPAALKGAYAEDSSSKQDLARMYTLFKGTGHEHAVCVSEGMVAMADGLARFFKDLGRDAVVARKDSTIATYVEALQTAMVRTKSVVQDAFGSDAIMSKVYMKGMEAIMSTGGDSAQVLAMHMDELLQSKGRVEEETIVANVVHALKLVGFIVDQDMFLEVYLQRLSKRLLHGRLVGMHVEHEVVVRMKAMFGLQFVTKISNLVTNYKLASEDPRARFDCDGVDVQVLSLKCSLWPSLPLFDTVLLPPAMAACTNRFAAMYAADNPLHQVTWVLSQGTATLRVEFAAGWRNVVATTLQAVVLFLMGKVRGFLRQIWFESTRTRSCVSVLQHRALKVSDIVSMTGINLQTVKRVLGSICVSKVLTKEPSSPRVQESDTVSLNVELTPARKEFQLPIPVLEERPQAAVTEAVSEDRAFHVDACIVRILKARREPLPHHELVLEILRQLRLFRPTERLIKQRIGELMTAEYIERKGVDAYVYCP